MPLNVVRNPGAEQDAYWSFAGSSLYSPLTPYAGARSIVLGNGTGAEGYASQVLTPMVTGQRYRVTTVARYWAGPRALECWIDKGDGVEVLFANVSQPHAGLRVWGEWVVGEFTALGETGSIKFRLAPQLRVQSIWYIDEVVVSVAKTIAIRDAIVTDLETITTGNGYSATVAAVYTEPEELERKASPSIQLEPSEGGQSDTESLTNRIGDVVQLFSFELYIKATDPITSAANLLDDIRNAIEVSTSTVNGIAGVDSVTVSSWSDVRTTDDIHNLAGIVDGEITVRYQYTRGSV